MKPAEGEATVAGLIVETDDISGLAKRVAPIRVGGMLAATSFDGW
jgi:2',3'-cyclic-nucleotide 2'-phosphodiesterase